MLIAGFLDIIEKKGAQNQPLRFWANAILVYGIFNSILGIILMPNVILQFNIKTFLLTFPISLLSTICYYCSVKAFKYCSVSIVAPILRAKIIWLLILSSIFINDKLNIF